MKNFSVGNTRDGIPYRPIYKKLTGSVTSAILFQQMEYWFSRYPDGFYKFLSPAEDNALYVRGDSWTEELGFSEDEFRCAFSKLGVRYKSKGEYDRTEDKFRRDPDDGWLAFYCSYHDNKTGQTFYFRNHEVVDNVITALHSSPAQQTDNPQLHNQTMSGCITRQSPVALYKTENTTETTSKRYMSSSGELSLYPFEDLPVAPTPVNESENLIFERWKGVMKKPKAVFTPQRRKKVRARLKEYSEQDILLAVEGCSMIDFNMARGDHQGGTPYNDLELICRDGSHVEKFRDFAIANRQPKKFYGAGITKEEMNRAGPSR